jgi:prevent-host-death family protein
MDVGIRELKAHLSEYLDRAERGEIIRVTDRGKPKVMLMPLPGRLRIEEGIREGWITPPRISGPRSRSRKRYKGSGSIQSAIDEDRGD